MIIPIILCGGTGSRLWPVSRENYPKQFLKIDGKQSLFQKTILRIKSNHLFLSPIIICNENYKFRIASELEEISVKPEVIIVEPSVKNTCPAISLAAHYIKKKFNENVSMLVMPSDHVVKEEKSLIDSIANTAENCKNYLLTFGITPSYPATGYGYIKAGDNFHGTIKRVIQFTEKPDKETAQKFIATQNYYWNSGIFLFGLEVYLSELERFNPKIWNDTKSAITNSKKELDFLQIDEEEFIKCENISIDYALLEQTKKSLVTPLNIEWYDLGNWQSIYDYSEKDHNKNVVIGENIQANTSKNCFVYSNSKSHIVVHKVDDISIILTNDALLVMKKNTAEEVKSIYNEVKKINPAIVKHSNKHYRPWGYYEDLLVTDKYRVKLISLNPHSQISLQYHNKRAEHWVITKGYAKIIREKEEFILKKDESTYIPIGVLHQIKNTTNISIEFIEVQIGDYVGEDDIVRVKDPYNRKNNREIEPKALL